MTNIKNVTVSLVMRLTVFCIYKPNPLGDTERVIFCERKNYMGILEDLWHGNIMPCVRKLTPNSKQYELTKYIARHEEALISILPEQAKETYEKLKENQDELSSLNELDAFVSGFQLGARIMLEVMEDIDAPYIDD